MARTPQDPQIRINEILDTAEYLFSVKGYQGTTISDIAKKMGVAQGMFYYYFKSKEEILEALINRRHASLIPEIKQVICSDSISPARKIEFMINIPLQGIRYKNGFLFATLYDNQNLHIKDKTVRQLKLLLTPWILQVIEEGICKRFFSVIEPQSALVFIVAITEQLVNLLSEKVSNELFSFHLKMAEMLIEKALGTQAGSIHIQDPTS